MRASWLMRFWLALLLLLVFKPVYAVLGCQSQNGTCTDPYSAFQSYGWWTDQYGVNLSETSCEYTWSGGIVSTVSRCTIPASCSSPKEDDGQGGCKCPTGTVEDGEQCKPIIDCPKKFTECTNACTDQTKPVAYFYCESDPPASYNDELLFKPETHLCECGNSTGCPTGQQQTISAADGSTACAPSTSDPEACPQGRYYGDFNGQVGCIASTPHNDPDESPNNCITGTKGVYYGSTLYCVPEPNSSTSCPTGTTSFVTDTGFKICKGTDTQGNPTGDSPDTNGSIKGTPTSGSGTGSGSGSGTGTGTGTDNAAIAAKLDQIKANTDTIEDALTGTASNIAQGSFAASTAQIQTEVETLKIQYGSTVSTVKSQMTAFLSTVNTPTGTGGLPCYDSITIPVLNIPFALCFTQFEQALSVIGTYIYGIAFLFAGLIILGGSRGES